MGARQAAAALRAVRIWSRIAPAALAAAVIGAPFAHAESGDAPLRQLEVRWQTTVPGIGKPDESTVLRLRVQRDDRLSFSLHSGFATLDGAGKILHRVALPLRKFGLYPIVPLEGGDFLVQPDAPQQGKMHLERRAADGRLKFQNTEPLHKDLNSLLHDAILLPDGHVVAVASLGPGPNNVMAFVVFDPAGRRIADHRIDLFAITLSYTARIYPVFADKVLEEMALIGTGNAPRGIGYFVQSFGLMGRVPLASVTRFLGEGPLECSAMRPGAEPLVGIKEKDGGGQPIILRWYKRDGERAAERAVGEAARCEIALRADGGSLVWLAPRRLLAFDDVGKPLWRADFASDVAAIGAMSDGDIVALHPSGTGVNVVRYRVR